MKTIVLVLAYDGTRYAGWQRQNGQLTIQETLEQALSRINNAPTQIRAASRTDAGVHAEWQIAAFDTDRDYDPDRFRIALNALTPADITVRHACDAPEGFQPRFQSRGKHYRYWLWQGHDLPPMLVNRAAPVRRLDIENMRLAANFLLGEHDFSAFRAVDCQAKSPIRTITGIDISTMHGPYACTCHDENALVQIDVEGTAFLKQMVRIIVGTLIPFGLGMQPRNMRRILESGERANAGQTVPAAGLTLVRSYSTIDDTIQSTMTASPADTETG